MCVCVCVCVCVCPCVCVCVCVCVSVRSSLHLVRFGQLLRCADKRIVNIMKVYITFNEVVNLQNISLSISVSSNITCLSQAPVTPGLRPGYDLPATEKCWNRGQIVEGTYDLPQRSR